MHPLNFGVTVCKTVCPMLSDRCPRPLSCLSVLSMSVMDVTLVCCCQTIGWIEMKLDKQIGLDPGRIVLDGDPSPLRQKGQIPQFSAHIGCGQMAGWIKMKLGTQVGLVPGHIVLDGTQLPRSTRGTAPSTFRPLSVVIKARHESRCHLLWR